MRLTLSTHLLVYRPLDAAALDALAAAGWTELELWLAEPHVPWRNPGACAALAEDLAARGMRASTVHLPFYPSVPRLLAGERWSVLDDDPERRRSALAGAAQGLRAAAALGAAGAVLHLGWPADPWEGPQPERARAAVAELLPVAREAGVRLLLENILSPGTRCARLVALLDELDPEAEAGLCLDLGHAHVAGGVLAELAAARPRLQHLHVHDNDGRADQHLAPGQGTLPWAELFPALADAAGLRGALEIRDRSRGREPLAEVLAREGARVRAFQERWRLAGPEARAVP